ncbi:hypothetical protein G9A89_003716 [Geosiphon pyriformis]|nr:hypothetical protein G9A89_003716 [Geosiphon pyriformis]
MATKAKNSKKQQQAVTTAVVTPNLFIVLDEIFDKISTAAASLLLNIDGNSNGSTLNIKQDQPLTVLSDMLFCVKFASQESLTGVTKVVIVALYDVFLGTFSDDIKSALGVFGVVTSVKLKSIGLWQYAVVYFKDTSSAAAAFTYWSVLVRKDSIKILSVVNQNDVISSKNAFKAKLVNLLFGCIAFEISNLVSQVEFLNIAVSKTGILCGCHIWWKTPECYHCYRCQGLDYLAVDYKVSPLFLPKFSSNFTGGPKVFKLSFVCCLCDFFCCCCCQYGFGFWCPSNCVTPLLPVVSSGPDVVVNAKLASLKFYLGELSLLIKFLVEPVGALVVLVTKLLFALPTMNVSVKENVVGLAKQNKDFAAITSMLQKKMIHLKKKCEKTCLKNVSNNDNINDNDNNDDVKDFSVYNVTFNLMMNLWEDQFFSIKFNLN